MDATTGNIIFEAFTSADSLKLYAIALYGALWPDLFEPRFTNTGPDYMKKHLWVILIFITVACENKKQVVEYHPNGKVKSKTELLDGVMHGIFLEYDSTGSLKFKEHWKNGVLDGPFEEYFPNGKVSRKGILKNNKLVETTFFFESGKVKGVHQYDEEGYKYSAQNYKENGERDSVAYPYQEVHDVKIGDIATFKSRMINVLNPLDSLFDSGELIITSGFDTTKTDEVLKDTIAIIHSKDGLGFEYKFKPQHLGENYVYGQLILKKNRGKTTDVQIHKFATHYSVDN